MIVAHAVAALSAVLHSFRYASALDIRPAERKRFLTKSLNLGLCYAGFAKSKGLAEPWGAGKAAFLCSAYDVVTDWRGFDFASRKKFEGVMRSMKLTPELESLATTLYEKELCVELQEDGLDRGYIALRFTLKLMGCEEMRERQWGNLDELGRLCQIVDDVLDYEQDVRLGETNCLTTLRRDLYLRRLNEGFATHEIQRLFGTSRSVLVMAIEKAKTKSASLSRQNPCALAKETRG